MRHGSVMPDLEQEVSQMRELLNDLASDTNGAGTFKDDATEPDDTGAVVGWIKIKVAGTDSWIPYYQ